MVAIFSGCAMDSHWLLHTLVQIVSRLFWTIRKFCPILSIQTRVFGETLQIITNVIKTCHMAHVHMRLLVCNENFFHLRLNFIFKKYFKK